MSLESEINKDIIHKLEQELGMYKCMEGKYRDMKTQRDTLIDDIAVLRANNERYRNRAENAMELAEKANCEVLKLERANAELMVASDKYTALTNHIRLKESANPGVARYIALVNFIDRLEKGETSK
ncbi:hypothetical protein P3T86_05640 [Staphylococcus nepalensis]|uniref:hypothetical protein n=1 Tax=Staphylococcus nepalensis TaxID=214473 RepID=UPI002B25C4D3|nr:hypothetical protein [Staphylococcus nepalensis]WQL19492.1 hypothetical protein P3T86_09860 [Staphylococcus nepalensis]WQL21242.1 hypothetical protein P3T86_05640 [Staphylococcus nepalensis]